MAVVPGPYTDVAGSQRLLQETRQVASFTRIQLIRAGIDLMNTAYNYLDLAPALAVLARDAGLHCWSQFHSPGKEGPVWPSHWLLMAHRKEDLGGLLSDRRWEELKARPGTAVWTDDFSNILSVLRPTSPR